MPTVKRILTKSGIDINADVFQLTAEQQQHIQTNYINTGKLTNVYKSVAGSNPGEFNKTILTQEFLNAEVFQEYINDPVIVGIKTAADTFYATRGVTVERDVEFRLGDNPPA
jgi:hypothetical protein